MPEWDREPTPTTMTEPHRRLHHLLWEAGYQVEDEVSVGGRYWLDCYVRELHLGFEADGATHRPPKARRRDEARDAWIEALAGIPILRLSAESLRPAQVEYCRAQISEFVQDWGDTVDERRASAQVEV